MSVKRYDLDGPDGWMQEWHEGDYVRFKDYETLKNSHDELVKLAEFVIKHPLAAKGMGENSHKAWVDMQDKAYAAIENAYQIEKEN